MKKIIKKVPRRERGGLRIYSMKCGTFPQETDIACWVPLEDVMKLSESYDRLMKRYIRERNRRRSKK